MPQQPDSRKNPNPSRLSALGRALKNDAPALLAGLVLALGQGLLMVVRPLWARFLIALAFVAPAGVAGFHATLGITRLLMPSEAWQVVFAIIGAVAVGITAFLRVAGMAAPGDAGGSLVRG